MVRGFFSATSPLSSLKISEHIHLDLRLYVSPTHVEKENHSWAQRYIQTPAETFGIHESHLLTEEYSAIRVILV